jgi:beta-glucosidase/6-phospho-beta-glucosidase/beta-galactosidase
MTFNATMAAIVLMGSLVTSCGDDKTYSPLTFGTMGAITGPVGKGSFRFGAASAATQVEDNNTNTDWYVWTQPTAQGGLGKGEFVADAVKGFERATQDAALVTDMKLDSYRLSIEWARIEPVRDQIDETAIAHYRALLENIKARGIRPMVTLHHFSNPIWVADPRKTNCVGGPSSTNLCGLGDPVGGPLIAAEMAAHAKLMAQRFGDLVDEWGTLNEPVNYLIAAYGTGDFPPGISTILDFQTKFVPVVRNYIAAQALMYKAIKAADTIDADGDGIPAAVGFTLSVADWQPARNNEPSKNPEDIAARDRVVYTYHYLFVDSIRNGTFDSNLDGIVDEQHPEWAGTMDWLGLQYYFRTGVTGRVKLVPVLNLTPCFGEFDFGSCLPPADKSFCVPAMGYEAWADGVGDVLTAYAGRYPDLPLMVTEGGLATREGKRRAANIVRTLQANFEWAEGFAPRFGLYTVDRNTYERTPTLGATVLSDIAQSRQVTVEQQSEFGGTGPMVPEPGYEPGTLCVNAE